MHQIEKHVGKCGLDRGAVFSTRAKHLAHADEDACSDLLIMKRTEKFQTSVTVSCATVQNNLWYCCVQVFTAGTASQSMPWPVGGTTGESANRAYA